MDIKRLFGNRYLSIALLFSVAFLVYSPTLFNGFVFDDNMQVLGNRWITDIRYIGDIFLYSAGAFVDSSHPGSNFYRPVMHLVYTAVYHVFGLNPIGFHLVNITLHALNSVMVFILASFLLSDGGAKTSVSKGNYLPPLLAGLLFALHPVNTEAVSWVAAVPELTFTFFYILAFYLHASSGAGLSSPRYVLSVIFYFSALFCKETAIVLPAMLLVYDYSKKGTRAIKRWFVYLPYLAAASGYLLLRRHAVGGLSHHRVLNLTDYEWVINIPPTLAKYVYKLVLPINLNAMYELHPARSIATPKAALAAVFVLILASVFAVLLKRRDTVLITLSWIFIPLLPVLYLPALTQGFADRYMYLSTAGFGVLAAWGLKKTLEARYAATGAAARKTAAAMVPLAAVTLVLYSAGTVKRSLVWKDDYTLWADTVGKSPGYATVHFNLGWALDKKGDIKNAMLQYKEAIRLDPGKTEAQYNLAMAYHLSGDLASAIRYYNDALRMNPNYENAHYNLASAYQETGDTPDAIAHYNEVIRLNPNSADAHYNLGVIYSKNRFWDLSIGEFESALRINPNYGDARRGLEKSLFMKRGD